eukprot:CAMPEP_0178913284 /NCGR_PEP_ID=MMETSP0786-20121207/10754_1 /TAXON_ID=186022 /ORGANISM="Thalassionema frauenfeldii, Strain CCMP 1798" /LENGTH=96 /DNA_ID=CAMNT_0020586003 /DNA_START=95 /DNA_END=385 /DNA_ORIENTATION=+
MRLLSTQGEDALKKFQDVMLEYRLTNYAQETPRRFKCEVVAAARDSENRILLEGMQRVLHNIGADQKLSERELETVFAELGENGVITGDKMSTLIC